MPYYGGLREKDTGTRQRISEGLIRLRKAIADQKVPPRTVAGDILIASWNIREFDSRKYGGRQTDALYYIAEIMSHFDLIAVQEVRDELTPLDSVIHLLGAWWKYNVTDVTEGSSGNGERMAFIYDSRKVRFSGLAGEIVLPPEKVKAVVMPTTPGAAEAPASVVQLARTPFVCGFHAGWAKIDLCTVHIYYGKGVALDPRRLEEIRKLADFLADRARKSSAPAAPGALPPPPPDTLILLGDFNIFKDGDATLKAITDAGFRIPEVLTDRKRLGTNRKKDSFFDQIAIWRGDSSDRTSLDYGFDETERGGVLDYYQAAYRDEDEAVYKPMITPTKSGELPTYDEWKTYQMSDHLVLWAAFKVDFADDYLAKLSEA